MTCSITISDSVDTTVSVGVVWKRGREAVATGDYTSVSDVISLDSLRYLSILEISPLDNAIDSGHYSCDVTIQPMPPTQFVIMTTAADTTLVNVAGELASN